MRKFTWPDFVRDAFDLNGDGRVTLKEVFSKLIPNYAVGIAFLVVDLLVLIAEYRVWDVGMKITNNNGWLAIGFVAVSALPFYLSQALWLYPRAHWGQQAIAIGMGGLSLYTSARFGLADLSLQYDVNAIVGWVVWLTAIYVVALLVYIVTDRNIRLNRMKVRVLDDAAYQRILNKVGQEAMAALGVAMEERQKLLEKFGEDALGHYLEKVGQGKKSQVDGRDESLPALPSAPNPPEPPRH